MATYNALIKIQRGDDLRRTWDAMLAAGIAPSAFTFSAMFRAVTHRMERGRAATALLERVLESLKPRHVNGIVISAGAWTITRHVARRNGQQLRTLDALLAVA
eukprot:CAMPEP_0198432420 /NCGR_PEP_ID=MMETSP1452-20131203/22772_1 /TAXON_ID=1181717 /ORGANISM="Synchroma pusillum, Strain CCMP3072" /LENGTH=102 /DNA_ID=CAMNT_0044152899 /DNA_START=1 /DNA_END=306 /DNA_ORIENTATION=-